MPTDSKKTIQQNAGRIRTALSNVCFEDIKLASAKKASLSGVERKVRPDWLTSENVADVEDDRLYLWRGHVPPKQDDPGPVGRYWMPNPVRGDAIAQAYRKKREGVLHFHSGLGKEAVGLLTCCFMESDEGSLEEQADLLDEFEARTGIELSLVVMSGDVREESVRRAEFTKEKVQGGRSLQAYIAIDALKPTNKNVALWEQVQRGLVALLRSDWTIKNRERLMRLPGVRGYRFTDELTRGPVRIQTILLAEDGRYELEYLLKRLKKAAKEERIDLDQAFTALQLSHQVKVKARHMKEEDPERAAALLNLSRIIRRERVIRAEHQDELRALGYKSKEKKKSGGGSAMVDSDISKVRVYELGPRRQVKLADGTVGEVARIAAGFSYGEKRQCDCPFHDDKTLSAMLAVDSVGRPYVSCSSSSCGKIFRLRRETPDIQVLVPEHADDDPLVFGRALWLRDIEITKPATVLIADLERGKTHQIQRLVRDLQRVLVIVHRRSLDRGLSRRLKLTSYQDLLAKDEKWFTDPRLVVTFDSLWRVRNEDGSVPHFDLVVFEESESVFDHLYGGTIEEQERRGRGRGARVIFDHLQRICLVSRAHGGRFVSADAFASELTMTGLRVFTHLDDDQIEVVEDRRPLLDTRVFRYAKKEDIVAELLAWVRDRNRAVVACSSAQDVKRVERLLREDTRQRRQPLSISAHYATSSGSDDVTLGDVNRVWGDADVVIFSPKIDTGVSYDRVDRAFQRVFVIGTRPSAQNASPFGVNRLLQQASRARGVREVHGWVDPSWRHYLPAEIEDLEREAQRERHDVQLEAHLGRVPVRREKVVGADDPFDHLRVVVDRFRRLRAADVRTDFFAYYAARGASLVEVEADESESEDVRQKLLAISETLQEGVREGREEARRALKWARSLRRVVLAQSLLAGVPVPPARAEVESPRPQVLLVLRALQIGLPRNTIASLFSELTEQPASATASAPPWQKAEWWEGKNTENAKVVIQDLKRRERTRQRGNGLLAGTGIQVFGRNATAFARIMGNCLAYFGLRTHARRPRRNEGSRVRRYSIDPGSVSFMQALVGPYFSQLQAPRDEDSADRALDGMRTELAILETAELDGEYEEFADDRNLQEDLCRLLLDADAGLIDDPAAVEAEDLLRAVRPRRPVRSK